MKKRSKARLSPYRRLEKELKNARAALANAVNHYIDCRFALTDAVRYLDNPPTGWTHEDTLKLERIHKLANS